jgi:hypothetical protein
MLWRCNYCYQTQPFITFLEKNATRQYIRKEMRLAVVDYLYHSTEGVYLCRSLTEKCFNEQQLSSNAVGNSVQSKGEVFCFINWNF